MSKPVANSIAEKIEGFRDGLKRSEDVARAWPGDRGTLAADVGDDCVGLRADDARVCADTRNWRTCRFRARCC